MVSSEERMIAMIQKNLIKLTNLIKKLPAEAIDKLLDVANEQASLLLPATADISCPHCGGKNIVKNGHKCGKQEYLCKCCRHTFVSTTNTMMAYSRQPLEVWEEMICDTLDGNAIDFSAKRLGLSHDCAFHMRHKILCSLQDHLLEQPVKLGEVTELDETFVLESYKGKKLPDDCGRAPRRHNATAEKRGISNEYVCICTGVQRNGASLAQTVNRAKPSKEELLEVFEGHICDGTLLLCDGLKSYPVLEEHYASTVKDVNAEDNNSFYNLNTVNGFHSAIKKYYEFYRGVATKFLNRYNALFSVRYKDKERWINTLINSLRKVSEVSRYHTIESSMTVGLLCI